MIRVEQTKALLKDSELYVLSDDELETVRNDVRSLVEIIFSNWIKKKENENETRKKSAITKED